ncbi:hypothetical protein [Salinispora sp. H7-4]|uniref:hypothetical protein n=1 Tax=Salinispora sp. H7-4 TaxID=2748321 RepID=UPI002105549C|nr:hypothetical protein [Salinispora sp. H7-4]
MSRSAMNTDDRRGGGTAGTVGGRRGSWAGYGAGLWSLSFAGLSFHWAAGGRLGQGTLGPAVEGPALAREPAFVAAAPHAASSSTQRRIRRGVRSPGPGRAAPSPRPAAGG